MPAWKELDRIATLMFRKGVRSAGPADASRLLQLYQQASADLASLRTMEADADMVRWLNRLVVRVHGLVYRGRSTGRKFSIVTFFVTTFPRIFRECWRQMAASFVICAVVYALAYSAVGDDPTLVADILGGMDGEFSGPKKAQDITERFHNIERTGNESIAASFITTNNIKVALVAFALGITMGIGTVYILIVNASMLGGIAGAFSRSGIESVFWATVLPHGALELSVIVIAGGAGLVIGWALWHPGERTRRRALREEAMKATLLAVGLIPAFIVAGMIEGFITPSTTIPVAAKVTLGVTVALVYWAYLLISGRSIEMDEIEPKTTAKTQSV